jgi:hypothetical protein
LHTVETLNMRSITGFVVSNSMEKIIIGKNASVSRPSHAHTLSVSAPRFPFLSFSSSFDVQ